MEETWGIVGDMKTTAMISRGGSLDFMCYPRYDSRAIFAARIDPENGGSFAIVPKGVLKVRQNYLPDTNVLVTRFESDSVVCEMIDFMPVRNDKTVGSSLIRLIRMLHGQSDFDYCCAPRLEDGAVTPKVSLSESGTAHFYAQENQEQATISLSSSVHLETVIGGVCGSFYLGEHEMACFHLGPQASNASSLDHLETLLDDTTD